MALTSRPSLLLRGGRRPWRASSASSSRGNSQHAVVVRATPPGPPSTPVHAGKISAAVTFTPPVQRRFMSTNTHGNVTRPSGAYLEEPKRETRLGLLKVFLTVITGLSIGAWVSQKMAAFLEENELFVPDDDDDDDDDDWKNNALCSFIMLCQRYVCMYSIAKLHE